ncbi:hypothetical protein [Vibrio parahaemolyticus]|uniref:hypothetical protein n=1 Tax=Vibrio parahaemolyticus TaxID=670 RepID=UPI0010DA3B69|nr:hypothetical protein [Vibrio parahaemolyticus]EIV8646698.1 hypothetical protein [Vibrio parahaemolyticus]EIV8675642.1 hypothetical protein [Vibrio parahaemolyticus]ELA6986311.1 hypothetical protein [Vibrio parahaemolyticus]MBE4057577.1 hypothetical protein [Vibrio parahaemolyticus]MBE4094213.1 hypothetical protein [Vibrio parahaemolyticus]
MNKIEQKLRENRNRRAREKLLSELPEPLGRYLEQVDFSSDSMCLRYAAFSTWDQSTDTQTTTRGVIANWRNFTFQYWSDLFGAFRGLPSREYEGWLFFDVDGPYYKVKLSELRLFLSELELFTTQNESFDFGWVGADLDCGVIAEFNHTSFCRNDFELSVWGI